MLTAGIGHMAGCRLVTLLVRPRGQVAGWSLRPPTAIYRLYLEGGISRTNSEVVFVRWTAIIFEISKKPAATCCAWWCLFHSTKRLCMKRSIKKLAAVVHRQGT
jgi:hypothetical protein